MADYQKLYALLCGVIDDVIDPLERIPLALPYAKKLRRALVQAEELCRGKGNSAEPNWFSAFPQPDTWHRWKSVR